MGARRRTSAVALAGLIGAVLVLPAAPGTAGVATPTEGTVIDGLKNPRGLTFDASGNLYVAESGVGDGGEGTTCIVGPEGNVYYGETGSITRVPAATGVDEDTAAAEDRIVTELPSLAAHDDPDTAERDETGTFAIGPADVSVDGEYLYYTIGLGADPAVRDEATAEDCTGGLEGASMENKEDQLATLRKFGSLTDVGTATDMPVADLGTHEKDGNPDGDVVDTNPFGLVADMTDGHAVLDSGANTQLSVTDAGEITTDAVFAPVSMDAPAFLGSPPGTEVPGHAVPTQLAVNPDGGYVAGILTGFPFQPGAAGVYQVTPDTEPVTPTELFGGFTNIMDVAVGPDEMLYVLEFSHNGLLTEDLTGALLRIDPATGKRELLRDDLFAPGGIAFHPADQHAYISVCSVCDDVAAGDEPTGAVIRYDAVNAEPLVTVANDEATIQAEDEPVTVDVLDNDSAADPDGLTLEILDTGKGSAVEGSVIYQPPANFSGEDEVTYQACDDNGHCAIGELAVTVEETLTDRLNGDTRIQTAVETSRAAHPHGATTVVIARSDLYPDALAAGPVAAQVGAPILLTPPDGLDADTAAEINRLGATKAYVAGGLLAISAETEQAIIDDTTVTETERFNGDNRNHTAVLIKDELEELTGSASTHVYVVEGRDPDPLRGWPDAVSVSYLAAKQARPILLATTDELPTETENELTGVDATIVGGPVAISDEVQAEIDAIAGTVDRLEGDTRYSTATAVAGAAESEGLDPDLLFIASGGNWPDALVAGPAVAKLGGILILVDPDDLADSAPTSSYIEANDPFTDLDLFGGTDAIAQAVEDDIRTLLTN